MKKSIAAAALVALSALGVGTLAHAEQDDPGTYQLNRWGIPATPENIARYGENYGNPAIVGENNPFGYLSGNVLQGGTRLHNWRRFGLAAPPAGYQWWRVGNEFVLADQYSGAIAQVRRLR